VVAPDVFAIHRDGVAGALVPEVTADLLSDVEEAVVACPMSALALSAGDDPP
jgi:ferredoxin